MKISIVIPTYSRSMLLASTILYLNKQTAFLDETEVLVIDDGSPDQETRKVVESFQAQYDLRYIYLPRSEASCVSKSRNTGLLASRGEIVIFLDDDILVKPTFLAEQVRYHDQFGHLLVSGHRCYLNEEVTRQLNGGRLPFQTLAENAEAEGREKLFHHLSFNLQNAPDPWIHMYGFCISVRRRNLINGNASFDDVYKKWGLEDMDFAYQLHASGHRMVVNPRLEVYHQWHGSYHKHMMNPQQAQYVKENGRIFQEKHGVSGTDKFHLHWRSIISENKLARLIQSGDSIRVYILRHVEQAEELKRRIMREANLHPEIQMVVLDETESNLDLWVQVAPFPSHYAVMYYPASHPAAVDVRAALFRPEIEKVVC